MEKERQEALQWFVNFTNMNLDEIKPGDKAKLLVEAEEYLFPIKEMEAFDSSFKPGTYYSSKKPMGKDRIELDTKTAVPKKGRMAEEFALGMQWAFKEQPKESPEYWSTVINLQSGVKEIFWQLSEGAKIWNISEGKWEVSGIGGVRMWDGKMMIKMEIRRGKEPFSLSYLPLTESHNEYLRIKLYRLLDGIPSHTIQTCPGCKKYFLNTTLRKKKFCSSRCMWRINAEKRRKADPEGYREKQREIMKGRYKKLQRAKGYKKISHYKKERRGAL